mgnify:CR=1 FL=1
MTQTRNGNDQRIFTIELRSKSDLKNASLDENEKVFIEGSLGKFQRAHFVDDLVLEVIGSNGVLRVDLGVNDLHTKHHKLDGSKDDGGNGQ